jgi:UDP-N-acetylmuramate dehydrogenase
LDYGDIKQILKSKKITNPGVREVVNTIIEIRSNKLPNVALFPNAGSFWQNSEISGTQFKKLQLKFPDIKFFKTDKGFKIPAAWLIEHCGFKGKALGPVSAYDKQPLVLVNLGGAKARNVMSLAQKIETGVFKKFGIRLIREINYIE